MLFDSERKWLQHLLMIHSVISCTNDSNISAVPCSRAIYGIICQRETDENLASC